MRIRLFFLAVACAFGIAGCAPWSMSPMEVGVFRGENRDPVADAKVTVRRGVVGIWLRRTEWSSLTSAEGIAQFPGVPDSLSSIDVETEGMKWFCSNIGHPKSEDCRTIEAVAKPVGPPSSGKNQLFIELRCKPKPE